MIIPFKNKNLNLKFYFIVISEDKYLWLLKAYLYFILFKLLLINL